MHLSSHGNMDVGVRVWVSTTQGMITIINRMRQVNSVISTGTVVGSERIESNGRCATGYYPTVGEFGYVGLYTTPG